MAWIRKLLLPPTCHWAPSGPGGHSAPSHSAYMTTGRATLSTTSRWLPWPAGWSACETPLSPAHTHMHTYALVTQRMGNGCEFRTLTSLCEGVLCRLGPQLHHCLCSLDPPVQCGSVPHGMAPKATGWVSSLCIPGISHILGCPNKGKVKPQCRQRQKNTLEDKES